MTTAGPRFLRACLLSFVLFAGVGRASLNTTELEEAFKAFEKKFAREYESLEERASRMMVFAENLAYIVEENAKGHKYTLGLNEFSDLTFDEFKQGRLGLNLPPPTPGLRLSADVDTLRAPPGFKAPSSLDWVAKGAVTGVRNQGSCGSCWSFSTAEAVEGAVFLATGNLQELSKEQMVDCDTNNGDNGCHGGLPLRAFDYVKAHGLCAEADYPYVAGPGNASSCHPCKELAVEPGVVSGTKQVGPTQQDMLAAVTAQPVSVAVEADQMVFQHYQSGVLSGSACGTKLDHAVLLVGFGQETDGTLYWKVKNSWGTTWGEEGYIRLQRGLADKGECGILTLGTVPVVQKKGDQAAPEEKEEGILVV